MTRRDRLLLLGTTAIALAPVTAAPAPYEPSPVSLYGSEFYAVGAGLQRTWINPWHVAVLSPCRYGKTPADQLLERRARTRTVLMGKG